MNNERLPKSLIENKSEVITPNQRWQQMLASINTQTAISAMGSEYELSGKQMYEILDYHFDPSVRSFAISSMGPRHYLMLSLGGNNLCEQACQLVENVYDTFGFNEKPTVPKEQIETAMAQFSLALNIKNLVNNENLSEKQKHFLTLVFSPQNFDGGIPYPFSLPIPHRAPGNSKLEYSTIVHTSKKYNSKSVFLKEASEMWQNGVLIPQFKNVDLWSENNFGAWKESSASQSFVTELDQLDKITSQGGENLFIWPGDGIALAYPRPQLLHSTIDHAAAIFGRWFPSPSPNEEAQTVLKKITCQKNWPQIKLELLAEYPNLIEVVNLIEKHNFSGDDLAKVVTQYNDKLNRHGELQEEALSQEEKITRKYPQVKNLFQSIDRMMENLPQQFENEIFQIVNSGDHKYQVTAADLIKRNLDYVRYFIIEKLENAKFGSEENRKPILQLTTWLEHQTLNRKWKFFKCLRSDFDEDIKKKLIEKQNN